MCDPGQGSTDKVHTSVLRLQCFSMFKLIPGQLCKTSNSKTIHIVCTVYSTAARAHNHPQSWEIMGPLLLFSSDSGNNGRPLQRGQLVSQTFHTSHALTLNPCTFPLNHFTLLTPAHFPSSVYPICPPFPFSSVICKHFPLSPCPFSPFTLLLIPCHSARFLT